MSVDEAMSEIMASLDKDKTRRQVARSIKSGASRKEAMQKFGFSKDEVRTAIKMYGGDNND